MNANISFDASQCRDFFHRLRQAAKGDFRQELEAFLEGAGLQFLIEVQNEIMRQKVMDRRVLLESFSRGDTNNVWIWNDGSLTLEVGTNVKYAKWVNDGHSTNPKGVETRFVPGYWLGDRFTYVPGSQEGMILKMKFVEGTRYWDNALRHMNKLWKAALTKQFILWLDKYFSDFL